MSPARCRSGSAGGGMYLPIASAVLLILAGAPAAAPASAAPLPDFNHIFISPANDAGPAYNIFGNGTYYINFEGETRGQNALHISTSPEEPYGQVTVTGNRTGTFYVTDTGGKSYEDEVILMVAVNGTMPEDLRVRISADGYTWVPNRISNRAPDKQSVRYVRRSLDETFTAADFTYGPQSWKPCGGPDYPIHDGQNLSDPEESFRLMFVDLNAGVLGTNATELQDRGAVRVRYEIENPGSAMVFNAYSYCNLSNNGPTMIAWTNRLNGTGRSSGFSGFTVLGSASSPETSEQRDPGRTSVAIPPVLAPVAVAALLLVRSFSPGGRDP